MSKITFVLSKNSINAGVYVSLRNVSQGIVVVAVVTKTLRELPVYIGLRV